MKTKAYTVLGWMAWQGAIVVLKRKLGTNKLKLGAAATVVGVLVAGLLAAKATAGDD
jgi:hypothetical protein